MEGKRNSALSITKIQSSKYIVYLRQSLAIDPITFTPEMLLHLGHVKEVNHSSASVVLIPIRRPGASNIAFGFRKDDFDENGVEEEVEVEENETVQFQDLLAGSVKNIESVDMLF